MPEVSGYFCKIFLQSFTIGSITEEGITLETECVGKVYAPEEFDKNEWTWQVKMNKYCSGYRMWSFSELFDYPDIVLAWFLGLYTQDESMLSEFPLYTTDKSFNWIMDSPQHIQVVTWAGGKGSNQYASVIDRYNSTTDERYIEAPRRAANVKTSFGSITINRDDLRKSIIRIK